MTGPGKRLEKILGMIEPLDRELMKKAEIKHNLLTLPKGSLGRIHELSIQVVGITRNLGYIPKNKIIATMAGDHGVANEGVSLFPQEVTSQMVINFLKGGAGINVLARHVNARVVVVDMGVASDIEIPPELQTEASISFINKKVGY
ncbi:MAG: nicotinate-nucleotide--dimethylbenzimidazole phosphoribosyltransferase, partial [bacterium]|nr:nicotinate-nucleotide--dimethylbenzimidazole phosphoribosyltransferase [bacterium]